MIYEDKETNDNWKKNNKMNLSASAFNSYMIEFSIPDFNETIIRNIISLFLNFSNAERHEVVFRTQWFIGATDRGLPSPGPKTLHNMASVTKSICAPSVG